MNPLLAKYLQEMATGGAEMPPAWQQGASVQPEAPPSSGPDLMAYFKGLHPEMFSQDSIQTAQAEDARSNDARSAQRSFARAAAYMTRNAPDYAGLGPTDQAQRNLQARQQQAITSAEVGSKVGQFRSAADAGDPTSAASLFAYKAAMNEPYIGPRLRAMGGPGQVSKAQIDQIVATAKTGGDLGKDAAAIVKDTAAGASSQAEADTKNALRPGAVEAQTVDIKGKKLANQNAALLPGKTQAEIDKLRADIAAGKNITTTAAGKRTQELRKEFTALPQVTNAATINTAHGNIAHANDDGFGDLTMIYSYIKLLDPTTGVRESEMANAQRTGGYIDQLRIMAEKPKNGRYLTPEMRASLKAQADNLLRDANASYEQQAKTFSGLATKEGLEPAEVVPPQGYGSPPTSNTSGPVRVKTPEEAMALPPGTVFITPDGQRKVRP